MKIALTFPGCHRRGGVERIMLEFANFLADRGHETHIYSNEWDKSSLHPNVIIHYVPTVKNISVLRTLSYVRNCRRALKYSKSSLNVLSAFGVISPPDGVFWAQSVHAAWLEISQRERNWKGPLKQKLNPFHTIILQLEQWYFGKRKYRKLIALTPEVKSDLMRFYGVPEQDIVIIPNGFAPNEFNTSRRQEQRRPMREKLGYSDQDKVIIFVANELERKGFGPLLRAIAQLQNESLHLLAVGKLNPDAYKNEIRHLEMSNRVRFTGPTSEVASYYSAADVFALPTNYEAWGLVIVGGYGLWPTSAYQSLSRRRCGNQRRPNRTASGQSSRCGRDQDKIVSTNQWAS